MDHPGAGRVMLSRATDLEQVYTCRIMLYPDQRGSFILDSDLPATTSSFYEGYNSSSRSCWTDNLGVQMVLTKNIGHQI